MWTVQYCIHHFSWKNCSTLSCISEFSHTFSHRLNSDSGCSWRCLSSRMEMVGLIVNILAYSLKITWWHNKRYSTLLSSPVPSVCCTVVFGNSSRWSCGRRIVTALQSPLQMLSVKVVIWRCVQTKYKFKIIHLETVGGVRRRQSEMVAKHTVSWQLETYGSTSLLCRKRVGKKKLLENIEQI